MENRRVKLTKKMMKEALLELLEKKPLEKITVTEICESADVNRSTFYSYYEEIGDVLQEIEADLLEALPQFPGTTAWESEAGFLSALEDFFEYVKEHERLFRVLIVLRESSSFNERLISCAMDKYKLSESTSMQELGRYAYIYCINGVMGVLKEWLNSNFDMGTKEFAAIVLQMSAKAIT